MCRCHQAQRLAAYMAALLGAAFGGADVYRIAATTPDGAHVEAIIDRWKLRPLVGPVGLCVNESISRPAF